MRINSCTSLCTCTACIKSCETICHACQSTRKRAWQHLIAAACASMPPVLCSKIENNDGEYTHKGSQDCGQHNQGCAAAQPWPRRVLGQLGNSRPEAADTALCQHHKVQHSPLHTHQHKVSVPAVCPHHGMTAVQQQSADSLLPVRLCSVSSSPQGTEQKSRHWHD